MSMEIFSYGDEPDFTTSGSEHWHQKRQPQCGDAWMGLLDRGIISYSPDDLYPTAQDPACNSYYADWPLECYWPVFLSNFFVNDWNAETWYDQISDYFAHKGLLTRMIYFHDEDDEYWFMRSKTATIDALVYFCSERDALYAITICHRDLYCGYRLNVLPGRTPQYLDNERSVRFLYFASSALHENETNLENRLNDYGSVVFATKVRQNVIFIEFVSKAQMLDAVPMLEHWKPIVVSKPFRKQRFLEHDVKSYIGRLIRSNPDFLEMKPRPEILQYFFDNVMPVVENTWKCNRYPKRTKFRRNMISRRAKRNEALMLRAIAKRTTATNAQAGETDEKDEPMDSPHDDSDNATASAAAESKNTHAGKTRKQLSNEAIKSVKYFMYVNGKKHFTEKVIKECYKVAHANHRLRKQFADSADLQKKGKKKR